MATPAGAAPEIVDDGITGYPNDGLERLAQALTRTRDLDRAACRTSAEQRVSLERMVSDHVGCTTCWSPSGMTKDFPPSTAAREVPACAPPEIELDWADIDRAGFD